MSPAANNPAKYKEAILRGIMGCHPALYRLFTHIFLSPLKEMHRTFIFVSTLIGSNNTFVSADIKILIT